MTLVPLLVAKGPYRRVAVINDKGCMFEVCEVNSVHVAKTAQVGPRCTVWAALFGCHPLMGLSLLAWQSCGHGGQPRRYGDNCLCAGGCTRGVALSVHHRLPCQVPCRLRRCRAKESGGCQASGTVPERRPDRPAMCWTVAGHCTVFQWCTRFSEPEPRLRSAAAAAPVEGRSTPCHAARAHGSSLGRRPGSHTHEGKKAAVWGHPGPSLEQKHARNRAPPAAFRRPASLTRPSRFKPQHVTLFEAMLRALIGRTGGPRPAASCGARVRISRPALGGGSKLQPLLYPCVRAHQGLGPRAHPPVRVRSPSPSPAQHTSHAEMSPGSARGPASGMQAKQGARMRPHLPCLPAQQPRTGTQSPSATPTPGVCRHTLVSTLTGPRPSIPAINRQSSPVPCVPTCPRRPRRSAALPQPLPCTCGRRRRPVPPPPPQRRHGQHRARAQRPRGAVLCSGSSSCCTGRAQL